MRAAEAVVPSLLCICLLAAPTQADRWPNWRGPTSDGGAPSGEFPIQWNADSGVTWKLKLDGPGSSTPAVWDERIFVTHGRGKRNAVTCLSFAGRQQWTCDVGSYVPGKHKKATGCNSSPVTDGNQLFVYFKSGDLACLDLDGQIIWQVNLQQVYGENTLWWDLGTSPVVTAQLVIVAVQQDGPSFIVALDKKTGQQVWKHDRTFDVPQEADQSYSTPVLAMHGGEEQVIVLGADHITGHRTRDGSEVWRVGGLNPQQEQYFRSIASPALINDMIVAPYARGKTLTGVRLGGQGDVTETHVAWVRDGDSSDVPTPANLNGNAVICTDKGRVICVELQNGEEVWSHDLPRSRHAFSSSPIVANRHIYAAREDGTTFVLNAKGKLVATNELDEYVVATPVFVDGNILIRGRESLYCIGHR